MSPGLSRRNFFTARGRESAAAIPSPPIPQSQWQVVGRLAAFPPGISVMRTLVGPKRVVVFSVSEGLFAIPLNELLAGSFRSVLPMRLERNGTVSLDFGARWALGTVLSTMTGLPIEAECL